MKTSNSKQLFSITLFLILFVVLSAGVFLFFYKNRFETVETNNQDKNQADLNYYSLKNRDKNNSNSNSQELETYKAELFIQAKWGKGKGEAGLSNPSEQGIEDAGPNFGPQSFDVSDKTGHLFLLDSINERVIEYDENGKYIKDFPIACGGIGDIRVSPDYRYLYVWSNRCGAIYKYDMFGKFLEGYPVIPGKNPGIGNEGIEFDENGNVMLELKINNYNNDNYRFYQIGKNGDEWKNNSYFGHISRDGKEYYHIHTVNNLTKSVQTLNKNGLLQKEFFVKLPQEAYVYYYGSDANNIYLNVAFEHGNMNDGYYFDEFIWKYNKNGNLIADIDVLLFLKEKYNITNNEFLPDYSYAFAPINYVRIASKGDIYYMFTFKNKGLVIFKYSKIE